MPEGVPPAAAVLPGAQHLESPGQQDVDTLPYTRGHRAMLIRHYGALLSPRGMYSQRYDLAMHATYAAHVAQGTALPDTPCATATCTTKAPWLGPRDWDTLAVCTCLAPLPWTILPRHGDVVEMVTALVDRSP